MIVYRPATLADCEVVASRLRQADIDEVLASGTHTPLQSLQLGVAWSEPAITCVVDDTPEVMFGVVPSDSPERGFVWLLGSDAIVRHPIHFARHSRPWLDAFHRRWRVLTNVVDARNVVHIDWLAWCGFRFTRLHPEWGPQRLPFIEFERTSNV